MKLHGVSMIILVLHVRVFFESVAMVFNEFLGCSMIVECCSWFGTWITKALVFIACLEI